MSTRERSMRLTDHVLRRLLRHAKRYPEFPAFILHCHAKDLAAEVLVLRKVARVAKDVHNTARFDDEKHCRRLGVALNALDAFECDARRANESLRGFPWRQTKCKLRVATGAP